MTTQPILVGYDGSPGATAAVAWALDEAGRTGAPVRLAYAFDWPPVVMTPVDPATVWPAEDARGNAKTVLNRAVAEAASRHPHVPVTAHLLEGRAAPLLREQSRHASLVVLGSRGHGGFTGLLLGSISQQLLHHSHCPVAVVRENVPG